MTSSLCGCSSAREKRAVVEAQQAVIAPRDSEFPKLTDFP